MCVPVRLSLDLHPVLEGEHQPPMDVLFLKVHIHSQRFQIPDGLEQHHSVPGEPGNRLGDDEVDVPGAALGQQPLELGAVLLRAGQGLVREHSAVEPPGRAAVPGGARYTSARKRR